jgi:serine protease SohB
VAAPFAVVGSIGVVTQVPNFHRLLDRAGVDVEQFTGGEFKRTVTMFGRNTDADREKLREQIEDTHALFKEFVGTHRPQVDLERVATGEYWYGARALELRLVDELVTSDDYLTAARERADVFELHYAPPRSVRRTLAAAARSLTRVGP